MFWFWKKLEPFKVKQFMLFLSKNINFNKNETESKMEISHRPLESRTWCLVSIRIAN